MALEVVSDDERERAALREELHNLESCQITFLTHSVTATGVLLGLGASLGSTSYPAVVSFSYHSLASFLVGLFR
jgi:hypothetical protein